MRAGSREIEKILSNLTSTLPLGLSEIHRLSGTILSTVTCSVNCHACGFCLPIFLSHISVGMLYGLNDKNYSAGSLIDIDIFL